METKRYGVSPGFLISIVASIAQINIKRLGTFFGVELDEVRSSVFFLTSCTRPPIG